MGRSLYNVTVVIYDPYAKTTEIVDLPGLTNTNPQQTGTADYHVSGIDYDPHTKFINIAVSSAPPFTSTDPSHQNLTGPNHIVRYDTIGKKITYSTNLIPTQDNYRAVKGSDTSGYQDMAETPDGATYAIGTFGNSIAKVDTNGNPSLWYSPATYNSSYGFGGIFSLGSKLVISDSLSRGFVVFDTKLNPPVPKYVKPRNLPGNYTMFIADGLLAPHKYGGQVALWSDDMRGTVVYGSNDGWNSADYLGVVTDKADGGAGTATVEIAGRVYVVTEFFQAQGWTDRSTFPFVDITGKVDDIVKGWKSKKIRS